VLERCGFTLAARTQVNDVGEVLRYRLSRAPDEPALALR
jgi:hypothetical protein